MSNQTETDEVSKNRQMMILSGNMSDFQINNLKKWPYIVFDNIKNVKISYNFKHNRIPTEEDKSDAGEEIYAGMVNFDVYLKDSNIPQDIEKRFGALSLWTKFLFWSDTEVSFKLNGEPWKQV